jgi:hypothetical protein
MRLVSRVCGCSVLIAIVPVQALVVSALPLGAQSPTTAPTGQPSAAPLKAPPTADSLDAISYRGYLLAQYDYAASAASDSVVGRRPDEGLIQGYVAHRRGERWEVAFGRLSAGRDTFYTALEARQRDADPSNFDIVAFTPARADTGYYARARRAIAIAKDDFGKQPRPYNTAVIERPNGTLWVYLMPAQVQAGVYPLGADVRYLFPADGRTILAKRKLHNTVIEYVPQTNGSGKIEAGTHTAVLDDIPEDTDVFHVLARQPRVPEYIVTEEFMYYVATNGDIRLVGRRPDEFRKTKAP